MYKYFKAFLYGVALGTVFIAFIGALFNARDAGSTVALLVFAGLLTSAILVYDSKGR
jgi:Leu/Phe-tRNA-protein transferase